MTEAKAGTYVVVKGPPSEDQWLAHIARLGKIIQVDGDKALVMFKEGDEVTFEIDELEILDWPLFEIEEPEYDRQ